MRERTKTSEREREERKERHAHTGIQARLKQMRIENIHVSHHMGAHFSTSRSFLFCSCCFRFGAFDWHLLCSKVPHTRLDQLRLLLAFFHKIRHVRYENNNPKFTAQIIYSKF